MPRSTKQPRELILDTAEEKKIPFQRLASSRYGTDTDAFAYSNGVASALISLPLRYIPLSKWCTVMMLKMSSN
jgi:putative aminopeptidase FrvX